MDLVWDVLLIINILRSITIFILIFHQSLDLLNFENRSQPWQLGN